MTIFGFFHSVRIIGTAIVFYKLYEMISPFSFVSILFAVITCLFLEVNLWACSSKYWRTEIDVDHRSYIVVLGSRAVYLFQYCWWLIVVLLAVVSGFAYYF